jgi:hypothetical protein
MQGPVNDRQPSPFSFPRLRYKKCINDQSTTFLLALSPSVGPGKLSIKSEQYFWVIFGVFVSSKHMAEANQWVTAETRYLLECGFE